MSWDHNVYYDPNKFGLSLVAHGDIGGGWDFNKFVVWSKGKRLYWATDSGCSCPTPFDRFDSIEDLESGSYNALMKAISNWGDTSWDRNVLDVRMSIISAVNDWRFTAKGI